MASAKLPAAVSDGTMRAIMDRAWKSGDGVQQLLKRERALVARVRVDDGGSVIAKLWCSPGIRALLRRKTRTSNCHAEWKVMNFLHEVGASVPRPLGHCVLVSGPYTEGLLIEDLGECVPGLSHVKTLLRAGREAEHERFIDRIIEMTELMVRHGVIDPDHGLHNILVCSDGRPVRIDFEVARVVRGPIGQRSIYGEMIGRLLTSYVFAAQPDTSRIEKFAKRLEKRLNPPAAVLQRAAKYVQEQLAKQSATMGVHTQVQLDW